jgi:signal transduction histidine kinase
MQFRNTPIQRKLMAVILLATISVLLLAHLVFLTGEFIASRQAAIRQLATLGKVIAANSTTVLAFRNQGAAQQILAALQTEPQVTAAALFDPQGKLFATYPANTPPGVIRALPPAATYDFDWLTLIGFQPVMQDGRRLGTLYLKFDARESVYRWILFSSGLTLAAVAVAVALAGFISRSLRRQISQPILTLTETARAISEKQDFSVRAKKLSDDELGLLTDAFNQMLTEIHKLHSTLELRVAERTAQMEAINRELESFSYSVSHDLRAPLRHINGFTEMLNLQNRSQLDDSGRHYLEVISRAAKQMGTLIDDLLIFSRMGRVELRRSQVNMDQLAAEALAEMADEAKGRNIVWGIGPLPEVNGDRAMFKQVWLNLFSNAVKYTRHRNPARITVRCRQNSFAEWEFLVQDNGAGFDMRYVGKLFGVFQRLHLAEEFEGTGIGLANVQRIILRHGGRVWAEGKIDEGAIFYFALPMT